jgi:hypothetical protein
MGQDYSAKDRQRQALARKTNSRGSYDRVLIVCEGKKTEPHYLKEVKAKYRLATANVHVRHSEIGTAPKQVVQYAKDLFLTGDSHKAIEPRAFEKVYVVIDRDDHSSYFEALHQAQALDGKLRNEYKKNVAFKAIVSVPCFELWLLLHFEDVNTALHRIEVNARLKKHMPDYDKASMRLFEETQIHLFEAMRRAASLKLLNNAYTPPQPFTNMDELVEVLMRLRG